MNPSPCRIVLYHFVVDGESRSRPAIVTSTCASDDVVNLWVFFEPADFTGVFQRIEASNNRFAVHPAEGRTVKDHCWSWPPRTS